MCGWCFYTFAGKSGLVTHMKNVYCSHLRGTPVCFTCEAVYHSILERGRHVRNCGEKKPRYQSKSVISYPQKKYDVVKKVDFEYKEGSFSDSDSQYDHDVATCSTEDESSSLDQPAHPIYVSKVPKYHDDADIEDSTESSESSNELDLDDEYTIDSPRRRIVRRRRSSDSVDEVILFEDEEPTPQKRHCSRQIID